MASTAPARRGRSRSSLFRVSALDYRKLTATILAMRALDKEISKATRRVLKQELQPMWQRALSEHVRRRSEAKVLATGKVTITNDNVKLRTANSVRPLRGGLIPSQDWHVIEFGQERPDVMQYRGSPNSFTRKANPRLRRRIWPRGYVIYQAVPETVPRVLSVWIQTVVRAVGEALDNLRK